MANGTLQSWKDRAAGAACVLAVVALPLLGLVWSSNANRIEENRDFINELRIQKADLMIIKDMKEDLASVKAVQVIMAKDIVEIKVDVAKQNRNKP